MTESIWERLAESRMLHAIEAGEFEDLEGAGKPLVTEDESLIPSAWRLAFHLLRNAGLAPLWIELDKEVETGLLRMRRSLCEAAHWGQGSAIWEEAVRRARSETSRLNRLIEERNLRCPWRLQRAELQLESETRRALGASELSRPDRQDG